MQQRTLFAFIHRLAFFCAVGALLVGCAADTEKPQVGPRPRPNVLFIAVDDLRPELGCYGNAYIKTPNIDRLASEGMTFMRAFCQQAACNQSRASLLTGLRPDTLEVWDLRTDFRKKHPNAITLPQHFKQNGYHCVGVGKIFHNNIQDPPSWSEPKLNIDGYPFDPDAVYRKPENLALVEQRKQALIKAGRSKRYIDRFGHWYIKTMSTECMDVPDNAYFDGAQTDLAIEKLQALGNAKKPFFFGVGYYRPHLPFNAPKRYWDLYDRATIPMAENDFVPKGAPVMAINNLRELRSYTDFKQAPFPTDAKLTDAEARLLKHGYLASVSYVDAQIGRLMGALDRLGLRENTIVVLWGDHGWKLGEHGSWCKMTNYDIDTRVPLIVSAPGAPARSRGKSSSLAEFVDIYPTLCEMAGLDVPSNLEGTSLVAVLKDPAATVKSAAFSQFLRNGVWQSPDGKDYMGYSIRTDRYRYVEWYLWPSREFAARELYDHRTDPREDINVAADPANAETVKALATRLKDGWRADAVRASRRSKK